MSHSIDEEASDGLRYSNSYIKINGNGLNGTVNGFGGPANGNGIHSTDESEENDK